jgi:D-3-phosphoglycerate dehydrogenase
VVSGGFEEVIAPVVLALGVSGERIRGNRFAYDAGGRVIGVDGASPLAQDGGKIAVARSLGGADTVMVGDGWTDLEVWTARAAQRFYAFTEVVARPEVLDHAQLRAESFEDLLRQEGLGL